VQTNEREEAVRLAVFGLAIRKAGKPPEPSPVSSAGVGIVLLRQCLSGKGSEELRKRSRMLSSPIQSYSPLYASPSQMSQMSTDLSKISLYGI
jgi:hypothetical protein